MSCHANQDSICFEAFNIPSRGVLNSLIRVVFGRHTGLGLFLSREILGLTGITITENGIPGSGARFVIRVPPGKWRDLEQG